MIKIMKYMMSYRPSENAGSVHLILENGEGADIPIDSPQEASLLLDLLRNESPVFYDSAHQLLTCGIEGVGEGEGKSKKSKK